MYNEIENQLKKIIEELTAKLEKDGISVGGCIINNTDKTVKSFGEEIPKEMIVEAMKNIKNKNKEDTLSDAKKTAKTIIEELKSMSKEPTESKDISEYKEIELGGKIFGITYLNLDGAEKITVQELVLKNDSKNELSDTTFENLMESLRLNRTPKNDKEGMSFKDFMDFINKMKNKYN